MNDGAKQASLGCYRATFTLQHSLCCLTKEPLFHTNSGSVGVEKRLFLYIMGATSQQNTAKTARQISKINFYFVTAFYSLYYICMGRQMIKTTIETIETTGFAQKQIHCTQKLSLLSLLSLKKKLVKTCFLDMTCYQTRRHVPSGYSIRVLV